jgi:hypothetical protein
VLEHRHALQDVLLLHDQQVERQLQARVGVELLLLLLLQRHLLLLRLHAWPLEHESWVRKATALHPSYLLADTFSRAPSPRLGARRSWFA